MTTETRTTIELKDILAIEFECGQCHAKAVWPVNGDPRVPVKCSRGCEQQWFIVGSPEHEALLGLVKRIADCAALDGKNYKLRLEIKTPR